MDRRTGGKRGRDGTHAISCRRERNETIARSARIVCKAFGQCVRDIGALITGKPVKITYLIQLPSPTYFTLLLPKT